MSAVTRFSVAEVMTTPLVLLDTSKLGVVNSHRAFFSPVSRTPYVNKTGSRVRGRKGKVDVHRNKSFGIWYFLTVVVVKRYSRQSEAGGDSSW